MPRLLAGVLAALACLFVACAPAGLQAQDQAAGGNAPVDAQGLKGYVEKFDPSYAWEKKQTGEVMGCTWTRLHMVSQTWHDIQWKHVVWVIVPKGREKLSDHALLLVSGGSWRREWPEDGPPDMKAGGEAQLMAMIAQAIGSPICIVQHVPFQPMFGGLVEDAIISTTFVKYLESGDSTWPLLLPMVKSAVRAMDASSEFLEKEYGQKISKFTVTGASKRGWTTWLSAAADPRVDSIAPMVIDVLNMPAQMKHQMETWGKYSEQIEDYSERGIQRYMETAPGKRLTALVDPFAYREKIDQPKLLIFGTNDRYWPVDACGLYWDQLAGEKHLLYCPNQGHNIQDVERVAGSVIALQRSRNGGPPLPKFDWAFEEADDVVTLRVTVEQPVKEVRAWVATSGTRDFRDSQWRSQVLTGEGQVYTFKRPREAANLAMFGEVVTQQDPVDCHLSTNLKVFLAPAGGQ
jgi:PhoPQ-activated pathogenicity-related protein